MSCGTGDGSKGRSGVVALLALQDEWAEKEKKVELLLKSWSLEAMERELRCMPRLTGYDMNLVVQWRSLWSCFRWMLGLLSWWCTRQCCTWLWDELQFNGRVLWWTEIAGCNELQWRLWHCAQLMLCLCRWSCGLYVEDAAQIAGGELNCVVVVVKWYVIWACCRCNVDAEKSARVMLVCCGVWPE